MITKTYTVENGWQFVSFQVTRKKRSPYHITPATKLAPVCKAEVTGPQPYYYGRNIDTSNLCRRCLEIAEQQD